MTAVPRLQQLPVPAASAGSLAVAGQGQESAGQRVKAVVPVTPTHSQQREGRSAEWAAEFQDRRTQGRRAEDRLPRDRQAGFNDLRADNSNRRALSDRSGIIDSGAIDSGVIDGANDAAAGAKPSSFSRLTSMPFMVQVLGQQAPASRSQTAPETSLSGHRDAALLGSDLYRRAGGEPEILPDQATFVRLAV